MMVRVSLNMWDNDSLAKGGNAIYKYGDKDEIILWYNLYSCNVAIAIMMAMVVWVSLNMWDNDSHVGKGGNGIYKYGDGENYSLVMAIMMVIMMAMVGKAMVMMVWVSLNMWDNNSHAARSRETQYIHIMMAMMMIVQFAAMR